MKRLLLGIIILLFASSNFIPLSFCANCSSQSNKFRDLIILLDDGNESANSNSSALTITLISLLSNTKYPFLVSSSIWSNFIERRSRYKDFSDIDSGMDTYYYFANINKRVNSLCNQLEKEGYDESHIKKSVASSINKEFCSIKAIDRMEKNGKLLDPKIIDSSILSYFMCSFVPFDPHEWEVYYVSHDLYLFVPISYINDLGIKRNHRIKMDSHNVSDFSYAEATLGLKIDHLKQIYNLFDRNLFKYREREESGLFIESLYNLFVLDYQQYYAWNICLFGHGFNADVEYYSSEKSTIANLTLSEFFDFLDFLDTSINTNFFLYTSCYAGGQHLKKAYKLNGRPLRYSFPIVATCLTDACCEVNPLFFNVISLGGYVVENDIWKNQTTESWQLKIIQEANDWTRFFSGCKKNMRDINNLKAISEVVQAVNAKTVYNTPWVRLAQEGCFRVLPSPINYAKIDTKLVDAHKKRGGFVEFKDQDLKYLFIMTPIISVPVIFSFPFNLPSFISLVPGDASHTFVNCISRFGLTDFISQFFGLEFLCFDKTFLIKKLKCKNDLSPEINKYLGLAVDDIITLEDLIINRKPGVFGCTDGDLEVSFRLPKSDIIYIGKIIKLLGGVPKFWDVSPLEDRKKEDYNYYINSIEKKALTALHN